MYIQVVRTIADVNQSVKCLDVHMADGNYLDRYLVQLGLGEF